MKRPVSIELLKRFPHVSQEERIRFHKTFDDKAVERLETYVRWRETFSLDDSSLVSSWSTTTALATSDEEDWDDAVKLALSGCTVTTAEHKIPQLLFCHMLENKKPLRDITGHRVMHHLPAQIDLHGIPTDTYATVLALYLDRKFVRDHDELITLVIDVRPGEGWPNPPALKMMNFIKHVAHYLHDFYPERLWQCIIYPVPRPAMILWHTIRGFLRNSITQHIILVPGGVALESPAPNKKLRQYINDDEGLEIMESTRKAAFC